MRKIAMRTLAAGCLLLGLTGWSVAEEYRPSSSSNHSRRAVTTADRIIWERAAYRAQQRISRTEQRKWLGISPQRPQVYSGTLSVEQNNFGWPRNWSSWPTAGVW